MFPTTLPARPSLEQLKKQAKDLLQEIREEKPEAAALFATHHPASAGTKFALHDAQLVLARRYGFSHWAKLKDEVERRTLSFDQRVNRFVCEAVNDNQARARNAITVEPALAGANLWTRLVLGDVDGIRTQLGRDPGWVNRPGGPMETWTPLLYVAFSRFQMQDTESPARFAACIRLLLEAGADPNWGWEHPFWSGSALKPLYGVTGVANNPAAARLLIERGAELNDGESIYHAAQFDHRACMEVLREAGVSFGLHPHWKNTPLYFVLGGSKTQAWWDASVCGIRWLLDQGSDPNLPCGENQETALHVAVRQDHDLEIIRWLVEAGADPNLTDQTGVSPWRMACSVGREDIAELFQKFGAREVEVPAVERFLGAVFAGKRDLAFTVLAEHRDLLASLTEENRLALNRAAERGQTEAVRLLLDAGFDSSFKGSREWGATPLHLAAWHGQAGVVDLLLDRGASFAIKANPPEESYAFGWAAHGSAHCQNPKGDYPRLVRALLAAGAAAHASHAEMASPEVADLIHAALAGKDFSR